jgi:hypothetical protein
MDGITVEAVVSAARELLAAQLTTRRAVTL